MDNFNIGFLFGWASAVIGVIIWIVWKENNKNSKDGNK